MFYKKILKEKGGLGLQLSEEWSLSLCNPQGGICNTKRRRREGRRRKKIKGRETEEGEWKKGKKNGQKDGNQSASIDYKAKGCEISTLKNVVFGAMAHDCTP